jgi:hypothetical protein
MGPDELHARLLEEAKRYNPPIGRSSLVPYRDVILLWRAKGMSYEKIAATLKQNGLKISSAGVGVFCRGHLTRTEIERARRDQVTSSNSMPFNSSLSKALGTPQILGQRGPRIARDDF